MKYRRSLLEEIVCVQERVAIELERIAMELVRATLDNHVQDAAGVTTVLRVDGAGNQVEFGERIWVRQDQGRVRAQVHRIHAVDQERVLLGLAAVGCKRRTEAFALTHDARS